MIDVLGEGFGRHAGKDEPFGRPVHGATDLLLPTATDQQHSTVNTLQMASEESLFTLSLPENRLFSGTCCHTSRPKTRAFMAAWRKAEY